jgi:ureidoacrylate peracid hydrolase
VTTTDPQTTDLQTTGVPILRGQCPGEIALVVIDMQNAFLDPACKFRYAPAAREIVAPINDLAATVRRAGSRVIWVQTASRPDPDDWPSLRHFLGEEGMTHRELVLRPGGRGHALHPSMVVERGDHVVQKYRYSAMAEHRSELATLLEQLAVTTLLISGTQTNICCESTARDAMMAGFHTILVADCLAAETPAAHAATVDHYAAAFGQVVRSAAVADAMSRPQGRREGA